MSDVKHNELGHAPEPPAAEAPSVDRLPEAHSIRICVCMGSSCFARGNGKNTRVLKEFLSRAGLGQSVELVGLLCEGKCSAGPNLQIDGHTYRGVAPSALETILEHHLGTGHGEKSP